MRLRAYLFLNKKPQRGKKRKFNQKNYQKKNINQRQILLPTLIIYNFFTVSRQENFVVVFISSRNPPKSRCGAEEIFSRSPWREDRDSSTATWNKKKRRDKKRFKKKSISGDYLCGLEHSDGCRSQYTQSSMVLINSKK